MRLLTFLFSVMLLFNLGCGAEASDPSTAQAQEASVPPEAVPPDSVTARRFEEVMAFARRERLHERPLGRIMQAVGEHFAGTPYVAGLLDEPKEETLVVNLSGFDCVLFVETALALARGIAVEDYSYDTFARHLREQRYRDGEMNGYCSRLHYFSEWIADNEKRGIVRNVTRDLGGVRLDKRLRFMSEHRASYPRFAENDSLFQGIRAMEDRLAGFTLYYIPQDRIRSVYDRLRAGDIIATATSIEGLDVSHSGLVYDGGDGRKGFLHASTSGGIKVSPDLQDYVENIKIQIGIVVARPVDARPPSDLRP
ncbi:N-acetylmuramoyl-L-alanine amidase-like domain-containing protein [Rhodocaloribacter sp.]